MKNKLNIFIKVVSCNGSDLSQQFQINSNNIQTFSGKCLSIQQDSNLKAVDCSSSVSFQILNPKFSGSYFEFPRLPPGPFRSYPWTGFGIMLPLSPFTNYDPSILMCGGSYIPSCSFDCIPKQNCTQSCQSRTATTIQTCGLINPESLTSKWNTTAIDMPFGRVLGDLLHLPDGSILLINGAQSGMAGWDLGTKPAFTAALFNVSTSTWFTLNSTSIPRLYHSTAMLLPDGRVMVAGSSPNAPTELNFTGEFQTEYRVEYYIPHYLQSSSPKPVIGKISSSWTEYDASFHVQVTNVPVLSLVEFNIIQPGFRTHSTGHGQRMVWLRSIVSKVANEFIVLSPPTAAIAPPGYYMLFVVCDGIPSEASWVQIGGDPANVAAMGV
jgi:hypothetical protein